MKKYIPIHLESVCHGHAVERYEFLDGIYPETFDVCLECRRICDVRRKKYEKEGETWE